MLKLLHYLCHDAIVPLGIITSLLLLILIKRIYKSEINIILIVLCYTITEITAGTLGFHHQYNLWFYNLTILPTYYLYAYLYYKNLNNERLKKSIKVASILFTIVYFINNKYGQGETGFNTLTYIPANTFVAIIAFMYMKQFVETRDENPFSDLLFWFSLATVLDLTGSIPTLCTLSTIDFAKEEIVVNINKMLAWVEYLWFIIIIIGLIWTKAKVKLPSSLS